jgi:hypothetical protein
MAVLPRTPMLRIAWAKTRGWATGCAGTRTSTLWSKITTEAMSLSCRRLSAMMAASRAWAMRRPDIEPERSMTKATLTGVRPWAGVGRQPPRPTRR